MSNPKEDTSRDPMGLRHVIESYDGSPRVQKWLSSYERKCGAAGRDPFKGLPLFVTSSVDEVLHSAGVYASGDWMSAKEAMMQLFHVQQSKPQLLQQLNSLRQRPQQSVAAHSMIFRQVIIDLDEIDKIDLYVDIFIASLLPDIHRSLAATPFEAFQAAVRAATIAETRLKAYRQVQQAPDEVHAVQEQRPRPSPGQQQRLGRKCWYCGKVGHLRAQCYSLQRDKQRGRVQPDRRQSPQRQRQAINMVGEPLFEENVEQFEPAVTTRLPGQQPPSINVIQVQGSPSCCVAATVNACPTQILVDTGAARTCVSEAFARRAKVKFHREEGQVVLTTASRDQLEVLGCADIDFTFQSDFLLRVNVVVVRGLAQDCLLGRDALTQASIDLQAGQLRMQGRVLPLEPAQPFISAVNEASPVRQEPNWPSAPPFADIPEHEWQKFLGAVSKFNGLFSEQLPKNHVSNLPAMSIPFNSPNQLPIAQRPYRDSPEDRRVKQEFVADMLSRGIIKPSISPYAAPCIVVRAQGRKPRFCVDYRRLNAVTVPQSTPLPRIDDCLDRLAGAKVFCTMDATNAYHQVAVRPEDQHKTAFVTWDGSYEAATVMFGLRNAPSHFQAGIQGLFSDLHDHVIVYLDDILLFAKSHSQMLAVLLKVLQRFHEAKIILRWSKCQFFKQEVKILGYIVSSKGVKPDPEKTAAIDKMAAPTSVTELQRFLGAAGFYRRHVPGFSRIAQPLHRLLRESVKFVWDAECQRAFECLKSALVSNQVLAMPRFDQPFFLECDASDVSIGAVLHQLHDVPEGGQAKRPVAFWGRSLSKPERNYTVTEKEALAVVAAVKKWRHYLHGSPATTVVTDHQALKYLQNLKNPQGRLGRWCLALQDIMGLQFQYCKGADNLVPDALSRQNYEEQVNAINLSTSDWAGAQQQDDLCKQLRTWIQDGKQPENFDKEVRAILPFIINDSFDGLLKIKLPKQQGEVVVAPSALIGQLLQAAHDHPEAGHMGQQRTLARLESQVWWPAMRKEVKNYVQACIPCQRRRPSSISLPMGSVQADSPNDKVAVDLMTLPRSIENNRYVLVMSDVFSKFVSLSPLTSKDSGQVAQAFLTHWVAVFGAPKHVLSDQGGEFAGVLDQILVNLGSKHLRTTAYHPQSNGQVERFNATLQTMLSKVVSKHQLDWDKHLPMLALAYNASYHPSAGNTPIFLMTGHQPTRLPLVDRPSEDELLARTLDMEAAIATAEELMKKRSERRLQTNNPPVATPFTLDQKVWLHVPRAPVSGSHKLLSAWTGPFVITKLVGNTNAVIKPQQGGPGKLVHLARLKPVISSAHAPAPPSPPTTVEPDQCEEETYYVEKILGRRRRAGAEQFRVKWIGYAQTTWEPRENIQHTPAFVKFMSQQHGHRR